MTLMDVIRHAHSNANILDRQYKERKANEQQEKAQAASSASDALPAPPLEPEAGPSREQAPTAPQLVLRDGKIVVDEASLRVQVRIICSIHRTLRCWSELRQIIISVSGLLLW